MIQRIHEALTQCLGAINYFWITLESKLTGHSAENNKQPNIQFSLILDATALRSVRKI